MRFAYYDSLSAGSKRTYRKSDALLRIAVPDVAALVPVATSIEPALAAANLTQVERACQALVDGLNARLGTPPIVVRVLERRPANNAGELHGLYEPEDEGERARITVWMRTAARRDVVAFKTFLRTLVHELCHHLDYELYKLPETFHTEGFYKRESTLANALLAQEGAQAGGS